MLKRAFDITSSLLGLLALLPPVIVVALVIKLDSPGPILYRATRIGKDGRPFTMFKFRTMAAGADRAGPAITAGGGRRITRVGRWLRPSKVDELPHLFNHRPGPRRRLSPGPLLELQDPARP